MIIPTRSQPGGRGVILDSMEMKHLHVRLMAISFDDRGDELSCAIADLLRANEVPKGCGLIRLRFGEVTCSAFGRFPPRGAKDLKSQLTNS
jgi:hypothetical protein